MENQKIEDMIAAAKVSFQSKEYKKAIDGFMSARQHYLDVGDDLNAAEMANNLSVALLLNGQKKQALEIVEGTDLIFEAHNEKLKQAMALGNHAAALESVKKNDEAIIAYQKSADLLEIIGDTDYLSQVLKSLAALQLRQGKQIESLLSMQQSLTGKKELSIKDRFLKFLLKLPFKLSNK